MTDYHGDDRFAQNRDFVVRRVANETILVPIRRTAGDLDSIYVLKGTAGHIWELLERSDLTFAGIVDRLSEAYGIGKREASRDLSQFLSDLESAGAIERVPEEDKRTSDV